MGVNTEKAQIMSTLPSCSGNCGVVCFTKLYFTWRLGIAFCNALSSSLEKRFGDVDSDLPTALQHRHDVHGQATRSTSEVDESVGRLQAFHE